MSIGNLSSAPDQAGLRSEHNAPMELQLFLPDGFAHRRRQLGRRRPGDDGVALVESAEDGDDDESSTASTIAGLLPLLLIVVAVYFLLLRPRQRQMRQQRELQSSLEVGDEVMLTSGVYGFITGFEPGSDVVWVEIDDDVQIRVSRAAISGKVDTTAGAAGCRGGAARRRAAEPAAECTSPPDAQGWRYQAGRAVPRARRPSPPAKTTTDEPAAE